jgi:hypothetical protein
MPAVGSPLPDKRHAGASGFEARGVDRLTGSWVRAQRDPPAFEQDIESRLGTMRGAGRLLSALRMPGIGGCLPAHPPPFASQNMRSRRGTSARSPSKGAFGCVR